MDEVYLFLKLIGGVIVISSALYSVLFLAYWQICNQKFNLGKLFGDLLNSKDYSKVHNQIVNLHTEYKKIEQEEDNNLEKLKCCFRRSFMLLYPLLFSFLVLFSVRAIFSGDLFCIKEYRNNYHTLYVIIILVIKISLFAAITYLGYSILLLIHLMIKFYPPDYVSIGRKIRELMIENAERRSIKRKKYGKRK